MPTLPHTYVANEDKAGWYLMLAEAYVDHIADYEPGQGSRVIPLFKALGRDFDLLMDIEGVEERARRMLTSERKQPDAILFELLLALSYRRDGWSVVRFIEESKGGHKTPDIQVFAPKRMWSIECKRIDRSQYSKDERDQFWRLWRHAMPRLEAYQPNLYFDFNFRCELKDVLDDYIDKLAERLVRRSEPIDIEDEWASGKVRALDLSLLQRVLETDVVMKASPRLFQLLVGSYDPLVAHAATMKCKLWHENGRYILTRSISHQSQAGAVRPLHRSMRKPDTSCDRLPTRANSLKVSGRASFTWA